MPDTREIPLTRGKVALVDAEDYDRLMAMGTWSFGGNGYPMTGRGVQKKYMHRLILNPPPGFEVDHINLNKLDNRRSNLRLATHAQNCANALPRRNSRFGLKGVDRNKKRWVGYIVVRQRKIHLGSFSTPEEAARAYDAAAIRYHGEFARLNYPDRPALSGASLATDRATEATPDV